MSKLSQHYLRTTKTLIIRSSVNLWIKTFGVNWNLKKVSIFARIRIWTNANDLTEEEEEESEGEDEEDEDDDATETTPADGLQTPSGMETPSGLTSVVSTVTGGLETPDFLELRKNATRAASDSADTGPRSLYQVVPEKQTSIRGLMGSERGYDVSGVSGGSVPVLGDERSNKVCLSLQCHIYFST